MSGAGESGAPAAGDADAAVAADGDSSAEAPAQRWLIALDVDGTVLGEDGSLDEQVIAEVARVSAAGHEVMLATGRSASMTLPIVDRLGIAPEFLVCANGALVLRRDPEAPVGYSRMHVETFAPRDVLTTIGAALEGASYAVEDADGVYHYTGAFPEGVLLPSSVETPFEGLLELEATRVVVLSPQHDTEEFLRIVDQMGLHQVSYNIGWTAWLDIAPEGVNKATGLEHVIAASPFAIEANLLVAGDGRNDIEMLEWADARGGIAVAMGQAPDEVKAVATEVTYPVEQQGLARALAGHFPA
ncbi:HAD family hydrolase [Schumannella sp. 10F1B-5-1]|uniref:HAD family hydrolase n=1 Tax=Schumannella sp. 10F1B-5-1 TaxID=2590780 RepID=UPI0011309082|nr:HAD family hydrolase [Schumannella sp. 10F1B-5-1]TPW78418.1 HAD family phosphatase [Schumannella sp. 10F1B-5-1]